ncbi:lipid binding protein [Desarmillaria tabescens]|uniref:Lipid binding protein n=1 Tax=Armillaria tabescens TaxID=1929756 RepID=A0AA39TWW6_ARMTA|nr:lipid binding protein [Desarmillaria tabescens]KAK0465629.1 lipid binding protein [Desarmillaria tabescens]
MLGDDEDVFDSVTWESPTDPTYNVEAPSGPGFRQSTADSSEGPHDPKWEGYLITTVKDPVKELAETKDAYVSYLVTAKTNLPIFSTPNPSSQYITGDRFSPEFMERRRLDDYPRHPTLQRSTLVRAFFESTEWVRHISRHPPGPEPSPGIIDNISDTLLNAFSRVRKPDERFLSMRENVDKFEEGLNTSERLWNRVRSRTSDGNPESAEDLTADYHDRRLLFKTQTTTDPFLIHLHSLLTYSHANRANSPTIYLVLPAERDRLAAVISGHAGSTGLGLGAYLKDRRLQDAVTTAHETSDAFSDETLTGAGGVSIMRREAEMKEMLGNLAEGQIEFYKALSLSFYNWCLFAMEEWERSIPIIQRIRVDV